MLFVLIFQISLSLQIDDKKAITKIAFGSCSGALGNTNPEIFYSISSWNPDLFIWLGDIIYADVKVTPFYSYVNDLVSWRSAYQKFKASPEYATLLKNTMVTGIWDDHDYGINDGTRLFTYKEESKALLMEFLEDGSVRNHAGIYHSFTFQGIKLILIDNRWFRDPKSDVAGDTLGEEQWEWLEKELRCNSTIKIIASGIQITTKYRVAPTERWHDLSVSRLMKLIDEVPGVILLSGDVHHGEIVRITSRDHIFYEITSSGLTHSVGTLYGFAGALLINFISALTYNIGPKFLGMNFGTLEIDWEGQWMEVAIRDSRGNSKISHKILISELYEKNIPYGLSNVNGSLQGYHCSIFFLVFFLPILIHITVVIIFLRKLSHSY